MTVRNWLRNNFAAGVLVLVPVLGTLAVFWWLFSKVTGLGFDWLIKRLSNQEYRQFLRKNDLLFRLLVLFLMVGLTALVGALARNFLGRRVIGLGERLLERIPFVKRVYRALKQMSEAFWGENKVVFSGVVAVEYPRDGIYSIGFVMSASKGDVTLKSGERLTNIFFPTTPNLTVGWFVMVPEEKTIRLNMKVEEAVKMIASGGVVLPENGEWLTTLEARQKGEKILARKGALELGIALSSVLDAGKS